MGCQRINDPACMMLATGRARLGAAGFEVDGHPLAAPLQLGADNHLHPEPGHA